MDVKVYTDGSCSGNPGPGGYANVLVVDGEEVGHGSGCEENTTNNRMELMGAIKGLDTLDDGVKVTVITDSAYMSNAFRQNWTENWIANGWKTSKGKDVKNRDLWEQLIKHTERLEVEWQWVHGHSGDQYNERADQLSVEARNRLMPTGDASS